MRVDIVDPTAYTPPYDHSLAAALGRAGADVRLITSKFAYGEVPAPDGYQRLEEFYRFTFGPPGSRRRRFAKLAEHAPDMARYRRGLAQGADVVHFQWLPVPMLDRYLLPDRPTVLTAHDLLPREPYLGQLRAQRALLRAVDAVVVHSEYGRATLVNGLRLDPGRVHVIHHGAFDHLTDLQGARSLQPELAAVSGPVVLCFGLIRPYKGIEGLLDAWRSVSGAELWIVGRPMMELASLRAQAGPSVRFVPRFVADSEVPALFKRADLVVLPYAENERYDFSGVLATALAFGKPVVVSDVGGFGEVAAAGAARVVPPSDPTALAAALNELIADEGARARLAEGARAASDGTYSWDRAAQQTLELYSRIRR
jgi:glycosyltransferase involved in cell wall biosynthesis